MLLASPLEWDIRASRILGAQISTWLGVVMYIVCVTIATMLINIVAARVLSIHRSLPRIVISELTLLLIVIAVIRVFREGIPNFLQGVIHKWV